MVHNCLSMSIQTTGRMSSPLSNHSSREIKIIYDGACPFCSSYISLVRLKTVVKSIELIDARKNREYVHRMKEAGMDINRGMLVVYSNRLYYGPDAMNILAMLSVESGILRKLVNFPFRFSTTARMVYPICRIARDIALLVLRRKKIQSG